MTVASVISYCTNDYRFIRKCIQEAAQFSQQIIVPVCDHFFNGEPENRDLLEQTYSENPEAQFIEFAYSPTKLYSPYLSWTAADEEWIRIWHSTARYIGFLYLDPKIETVLFLDCDEIVEGNRFAEWLSSKAYEKFTALRLLCYYYILRPTLRAKKLQELPLLCKRSLLEKFAFFQPDERYGLYRFLDEPKRSDVRGLDGNPLVHHYSWVRPRHESLQKAASWGHRGDLDWKSVIDSSFADQKWKRLFGADFEFEEIDTPYFDPFSVERKTKPAAPALHKKVTHRDSLLKEFNL